ncbi:MAG: glycerol-3-phosphate acyltransferase [bacterium]
MAVSLLIIVGAYLTGGVNFALVLAGLGVVQDPREAASGNPGVSNVYRVSGPVWAAVVLLLDLGRAAGVALLSLWLLPRAAVPLAGLALVLGNLFPLFHGFRGGKGVANFLGFCLGIHPLAAGLAALTWPVTYAAIRLTFASSFVMVGALAAVTAWRLEWHPLALAGCSVTVAVIFWAHRSNVMRWRRDRS